MVVRFDHANLSALAEEGDMLARQIAIGFGIAIIFPLLVYYGVASVYPPPQLKYEAYASAVIAPGPNATPEERQKYAQDLNERQQRQRAQQAEFAEANRDFARYLVVISTPLGVSAILIGAYLPLYAIGTGLIFGGTFTVGSGYWQYWSYLENWVRFASLLAGFVILIFVGYYRVMGGERRASLP
jgi:uncharacterized membrane protein YphA (DoxX/SURF4 family)